MENFNFGWAASGLTMILYSLPIFSFINFFSKKSNFENIPSLKLFTNYAKSIIWYFYGCMLFDQPIQISSKVGGITSLLFIIMYILIEIKRYRLDSILNCIMIIIGTLSSFEWFSHITLEKNLVGGICLKINIISALSQLPDIYNGIKTKTYSLIRVNYSIIAFPTHLCWIFYGLILDEYYILTGNLISISGSVIQILLYWYYKKVYPNINEVNVEAATIDIIYDEPKRESKERPVEIINLKYIK